MENKMEQLKEKAKEINLELNEEKIKQFNIYYECLIEKNKVMNLTAITEKNEVIDKHFVDSIAIKKVLEKENGIRQSIVGEAIEHNKKIKVLDIGTGAGFPGIPLKIVYSNWDMTLLDSLNKRIKFLQEVVEELELPFVELLHGRAEDYAKQKEYRGQYDLCVSRAVAHLATLSEYCLPYVKIGGYFISYKSGTVTEELEEAKQAIGQLGGKVIDVVPFSLPDTDIERTFVIIKKVKETPNKFPRKAGLPAKEPIGYKK